MPDVRRGHKKLWNLRRQLLGNLIPAAVGLPMGAYGFVEAVKTQQFVGTGLGIAAAAVALMWLLANFAGAIENPKLKKNLMLRLSSDGQAPPDGAEFVGFARPAYVGWLDPHEDIGFLSLTPEAIQFRGESVQVQVAAAEVERVRYRFNFHTLAGLGRWVSVEGKSGGVPFRLLVEPREKRTLLGNLLHSKRLKKKIDAWLKERRPEPRPGP